MSRVSQDKPRVPPRGDHPPAAGAPRQSLTEFHKVPSSRDAGRADQSAVQRYRDFFIGRAGMGALIAYELVNGLAASRSGAFGYWLRKKLFPYLLGEIGPGVLWGRHITLRHGRKMRIGAGTVIDDNCLLCARGAEEGGFVLGNEVAIARNSTLIVKKGFMEIGDHCSIGSETLIGAVGGIRLGDHVLVAGHSYIGGARYGSQRSGVPMMNQGMYSRGPVEIGDDVWLGAGVRVLDGVKIGTGVIVAAGAVVTRDVPDFSIVGGVPARVLSSRPAASS